jgi:2'-5' RNA ligase
VVLVPAPIAAEVQGLRRACGDPALERVPPHVTLVPPVNVNEVRVGDALELLRDAATDLHPFTLQLGPVATFAPDSPTLYLSVGGDDDALAALERLREAVFQPSVAWPAQSAPPRRCLQKACHGEPSPQARCYLWHA